MTTQTDWDEADEGFAPTELASVDEAQEIRTRLLAKIAQIEGQLGSRGFDENGKRLYDEYPDYRSWWRKAKMALHYRREELRAVNAWIKEHNREEHEASISIELGKFSEIPTRALLQVGFSVLKELQRRLPGEGE